jgi:hypothetical protein
MLLTCLEIQNADTSYFGGDGGSLPDRRTSRSDWERAFPTGKCLLVLPGIGID